MNDCYLRERGDDASTHSHRQREGHVLRQLRVRTGFRNRAIGQHRVERDGEGKENWHAVTQRQANQHTCQIDDNNW